MYRRDIRDTRYDTLLADLASVDSVVQAVPSPTDDRIAYAKNREGQTDLWLLDDEATSDVRLTSEGVVAVRYGRGDPRWFDFSPDGTELAYLSASGSLSVVDLQTGEKRALVGDDAADLGLSWSDDGSELAVVANRRSRATLGVVAADGSRLDSLRDDAYLYADPQFAGDDVYAIRAPHRSLFDDEATLVRVARGDVGGDPEGDAIFAESDVRAASPRPRPGAEEEIAFVHDGSGFDAVYLATSDGNAGGDGDDDGGNGDWHIEPLFAEDGAEVAAPSWHPDGDRLAVTVTRDAEAHVWTLELDGSEVVEREQLTEGKETHTAPAWDGDSVLSTADSPTTPAAIRDVSSGERRSPTTFVGLEDRLSTPERLSYESSGREIQAVVYPPADDAESDSVPLLVKAHGGPTSYDKFAFDYRAQYFVALGYAVILPNYRGSDAYGRAFRNANDHDWGGGDLDDVINAADAVADTYDAVDGDRAGIFGGSGGGLMTANALGNSDRFRAGAAFYGVYDYESFVDDTDDVGWQLMKRELGDLATDLDNYRAASPIRHVADIDAPLLVLHGEDDARVPISQSEQLVDELEAHGKRYEFRRYDGEPHGFGQRENVVDAYTRVADLFAKYLQVDPDRGTSRPHPPE
ncbi:hypothetical protein AUR64_17075 [Haloprofundus marisrubri]|uniref:Peptidase S9 prolyl oligopeptidase catalytic domain-containing protein n=1 Tax=Haloprofundus marisrubri TaxID=1514971 RepID=A0A0W1R7W6_9EURY|nr:prolyl oligopeptidase family serine peptidase [Haloprofundus marisrubri]KTG09485.1 hypothetical protein AUR64_17075 [Haloprofundus marisrubri]